MVRSVRKKRKMMESAEINWLFQPCTSRLYLVWFFLRRTMITQHWSRLVKIASEHVRISHWNVSLVKPGYHDLLSHVTFLLVL